MGAAFLRALHVPVRWIRKRESPDFQLITLGGLGLDAPRGTDTGTLRTQRRKLAVLTVLALSRKPVPRDRLVEMFRLWEEATEPGREDHGARAERIFGFEEPRELAVLASSSLRLRGGKRMLPLVNAR